MCAISQVDRVTVGGFVIECVSQIAAFAVWFVDLLSSHGNKHFQFRGGLLFRIDDEFDYYNARRNFEELLARLGISPLQPGASSP